MSDNIHGDDADNIHERNQKALRYLEMKQMEQERADRASCKLVGCVALMGFNVVFWWAVYVICKALGEF